MWIESFVKYMYYKYLLPVCGMFSLLLILYFEVLNFNKSNLSILMVTDFVLFHKKLPTLMLWSYFSILF